MVCYTAIPNRYRIHYILRTECDTIIPPRVHCPAEETMPTRPSQPGLVGLPTEREEGTPGSKTSMGKIWEVKKNHESNFSLGLETNAKVQVFLPLLPLSNKQGI